MIKTLVTAMALCAATAAFAQQAPAEGTVATWSTKSAHAWAAPTHMMLVDATRADVAVMCASRVIGERSTRGCKPRSAAPQSYRIRGNREENKR